MGVKLLPGTVTFRNLSPSWRMRSVALPVALSTMTMVRLPPPSSPSYFWPFSRWERMLPPRGSTFNRGWFCQILGASSFLLIHPISSTIAHQLATGLTHRPTAFGDQGPRQSR